MAEMVLNLKSEYSRHGNESWIRCSVLVLVSYIAWSGWLILQAKVDPPQLSLNALICFIASLQSSVLALFFCKKSIPVETGPECTAFDHHGVVLSELVFYLQTWCIINKGPVFFAMFTPLLVAVAIFSAIVFAERLHLGSMVGTFLIVLRLYFVLWGKRRYSFVAGNTKNGDDRRLVVIPSIKCPIATREAMC
ncbi:Nodulin MtN21/EamA-like transporter family protein isoform 3 [Gossypium australe]|uniref:Nodulin MtN21/EamA-like transporter family protein isoform 3 n=1 Tax=Gossypium australe TaxID=47621 RepID=A0A5B6VM57_9ROSI|nr:Nodulin MtN21/EamA-like transporter family protein isoform 3 [Gossypium australe]